jgi:polyhydroxyalkanoate synthase
MENRQPPTKPEEVAKVYREVAKSAAKVLDNITEKRPQLGAVRDELGIAKAYMDLYVRMLADPMALAAQSIDMWLDYARLWQSNWMKILGRDVPPIAAPAENDGRFKDDAWTNTFLFDFPVG